MSDLTLRRVDYSDAIAFLAWWNDRETRRFSGPGAPVTLEEHLLWFFENIKNPHWYVGTSDGRAVGAARLDRAEGNAWWISIVLDPRMREQGYGTALIKLVTACVDEPVLARIHRFNVPSLRAFEKAGFVLDRSEAMWKIYRHATEATTL